MKKFTLCVSVALLFAVSACEDVETPLTQPGQIKIISTVDTVLIGDTVSMIAVEVKSNGDTVSTPNVAWSTSDNSIVVIDTAGVVRGIAEGNAQIRASMGERLATKQIVVSQWSAPRVMRGHYYFGFEASAFKACGEDEYIWSPFRSEVNAFITGKPEYFQSSIPGVAQGDVYVDWMARESGAGSYGHLGTSRHQLDVLSVSIVRATKPDDCTN